METLLAYLPSLLLTVVIECVVALGLAPRRLRRRTVATALFANLFTHPFATMALGALRFPSVEIVVLLIEWLLFRLVAGLGIGRALLLACVANGATVIAALWWWS